MELTLRLYSRVSLQLQVIETLEDRAQRQGGANEEPDDGVVLNTYLIFVSSCQSPGPCVAAGWGAHCRMLYGVRLGSAKQLAKSVNILLSVCRASVKLKALALQLWPLSAQTGACYKKLLPTET